MFESDEVFSSFSCDDIHAAREFYSAILGFRITEHRGMLSLQLGPGRSHLIYAKADHLPASYTALNLPVADVEAAVGELAARGVMVEKFPGVDDDGIMRQGGALIAWFKDPAGNIISVIDKQRSAPVRTGTASGHRAER